MFEHIMLDLETMDTAPTAAILSIGAVRFDSRKGLGDEFYQVVDIESCQRRGMTVSGNTIEWWMKQSPEARRVFFQDKVDIEVALGEFTDYVKGVKDSCMWGNGSTFDNAIIRNAFTRCELPTPWSYKKDFCFRTVLKNFPGEREESRIWHNALEDAKAQARTLLRILRSIHK